MRRSAWFRSSGCFTSVFAYATLALTEAALAAPVLWTGHPDGYSHWYEYRHLDGYQTWSSCSDAAQALPPFLGVTGDLATSTSLDENAFIAGVLAAEPGPVTAWLGAKQFPPNSPPAENWEWVTGEPWVFENWAPGEPNDAEPPEDALAMFGAGEWLGMWNDAQDGGTNPASYGFVVEWVLPEPSTAVLLAASILGIRRRYVRHAWVR